MRAAIIGGGAAGFFAAVNLKEMVAPIEVTIFERSQEVLRKVEISGGGRCNCTNSFNEVTDLSQVYPRGHRLMKRLFKTFNHQDVYRWFERHGVKLVTQDDQCVFPASQDAHAIINCFLREASRLGINIRKGQKINSLEELVNYDYIIVTTGGSPKADGLEWLGHEIVQPVPSLFTFNIEDAQLRSLMGTVVEDVSCSIPGQKLKASGPLLITHWGVSGPSVLRLSSYAARLLADNDYQQPLAINWTNSNETEVQAELNRIISQHPQKQITSISPFGLPCRLWNYLAHKCLEERATYKWKEMNRKEFNRMVNLLVNDTYQISGRAAFKDEFVTCGGISLNAVSPVTLESKTRKHLYFAGEVLDIDGVTGGFNFQAAWTTAFTVAQAIKTACKSTF